MNHCCGCGCCVMSVLKMLLMKFFRVSIYFSSSNFAMSIEMLSGTLPFHIFLITWNFCLGYIWSCFVFLDCPFVFFRPCQRLFNSILLQFLLIFTSMSLTFDYSHVSSYLVFRMLLSYTVFYLYLFRISRYLVFPLSFLNEFSVSSEYYTRTT